VSDDLSEFDGQDAGMPPPDERQQLADAEPEAGLVNWNPAANAMADAQGVEPGSWDWVQAGPAAFSGSSGAQASYGWDHRHKLRPDYIRAVLANYGHRRSYYSNAPYRQFGYEAAGRPHGWEPESPGDQRDGSTIYMTSSGPVRVTGPDAEHLWLTPLFALVDDPQPILVDTGMGNQLPSNVVAKWLATMLVSSAVGMVRDHRTKDGNPYPWTYGDRATGRILHTITEGLRRGCLPASDIPTAAHWIGGVVLPFYESGAGIHRFGRYTPGVHPGGADGKFPIGLFNGLHWIVPAAHDAAIVLRKKGAKKWADRFDRLVARWSLWMSDMHEVLPHECFRADRVFVGPAIEAMDRPPASIKKLLRAEHFHQSFDFRSWAFRAVDVAAETLNSAPLREARDRIADDYRNDANARAWMVRA